MLELSVLFLFQNFKAALRGQPVEGKISNQHYLHSYLTYLRLTKTIERNLLLIDNLKRYLPDKKIPEGHKITKPQDLVRLYDIIIQVGYYVFLFVFNERLLSRVLHFLFLLFIQ